MSTAKWQNIAGSKKFFSTNPISHDVEYHQATAPSSFILFGSEKAQRKAKRGWQREISTHFSFREPRARSTQAHR